MKTYTVHQPPGESADVGALAERIVFIREGFSWFAFLFPVVWLVWNRLWLEFIGFIGVIVLVELLAQALGAGPMLGAWLAAAIGLVLGFEAHDLRRGKLERSGWRMVATVVGPDRVACELKFFDGWLARTKRSMLTARELVSGIDAGRPRAMEWESR